MAAKTYTVSENQSIFDLCIIIYGSLNYLNRLMADNDLTIDTYIAPGTQLIYDNDYTPNTTRYTTGGFLWTPPVPVTYLGITALSILRPIMYHSYVGGTPSVYGSYSYMLSASSSFVSYYGITGSWTNSNTFRYVNEINLLAGGLGVTAIPSPTTTMGSRLLTYNIPYSTSGISFNLFAGTGPAGFNGDFTTYSDGALRAQLSFPTGVAYSPWDGAIYFSDSLNYRIRALGSGTIGNITTISGTGTSTFVGPTGPATSARWRSPTSMYFNSSGTCYITDEGSNRVRSFDTFFNMSVIAGTGLAGFSGDGGLATSARLNSPGGVCGNTAGDIFIADKLNYRIRKVSGTDSTITTYAGSGTVGYAGNGSPATSATVRINIGSIFSSLSGVIPMGAMSCNNMGDLYFCDTQNHCIRKVGATNSIITTVLGNPTGVVSSGTPSNGAIATASRITQPTAIAIDSNSNIYVGHASKSVIKFTDGGSVTNLFNLPASSALIGGMCVDPLNNLYITNAAAPPSVQQRVYKYSPSTASNADIYVFPNLNVTSLTFSNDSSILFQDLSSYKAVNSPIVVLQGSGSSQSFVKDYLIGNINVEMISSSGLTATLRLTKSHNTPVVNLTPSTTFYNATPYSLYIDPSNPTSSNIKLTDVPVGVYSYGVITSYTPTTSTFSYGTSFCSQVIQITNY